MNCSECRYSHRDAEGTMECRRHAPTGNQSWPPIAPGDWCGEFALKPELEPCRECGKPVGAYHWNLAVEQEGPDFGTLLRAAEMSPVCGDCFALMEKGEHPRQITARREEDKPPLG